MSGLVSTPVRPLALDLTKPESIDSLEHLLAEERPHIHILINAAGFRKNRQLQRDFPRRHGPDDRSELPCRRRRNAAGASIYEKGRDRILEICSTAAFQPFPPFKRLCLHKIFSVPLQPCAPGGAHGPQNQGYQLSALWVKNTEFIPTAQKTDGGARCPPFPPCLPAGNLSSVWLFPTAVWAFRYPLPAPSASCTASPRSSFPASS